MLVPSELSRRGHARRLTHLSGTISSPAPQPDAAEPRDEAAPDAGHAEPDMATCLSQLEAMALESKDSEAAEDGP